MKLMNPRFLLSGLLALVLLASPPCGPMRWRPTLEAPASTEVSDPWGSTDTQATDWQNQIEAADTTTAIDWLDPFQQALVPLDTWVEGGIGWLVENLRPLFQLIRAPVELALNAMTHLLQTVPSTLMMGLLTPDCLATGERPHGARHARVSCQGSALSGPGPMPW